MSNYDHLPTEAINEQITQLESIVGSSEPPKPEKPSLFSPAGADKLNSEMGAVFDRLQNANEKRSHEEAVLKPVEETGLKGATDGFRNESMKAQLTLCQAMLQEIAIRRIDQQIKQIADQLPNNGTLH